MNIENKALPDWQRFIIEEKNYVNKNLANLILLESVFSTFR